MELKHYVNKLKIDYKVAVTGFSLGGNGMHYPIIKGVVIHNRDLDKVIIAR